MAAATTGLAMIEKKPANDAPKGELILCQTEGA
jgi:hypothetical protein